MDIGQHCSVDDNVWNNTKLLRLGIEMAHGNEFAACFQGISKPSNSLHSYESALIEGEVLQDDPSDYAHGITRDVCFDDGRATIRVKDGRAWGLYRDFVADAAGLGIAGEFSAFNNGSNQPVLDRTDSTYNLLITTKGEYPVTAAIYLHAASGYHHGIAAREDAFPNGGTFLALYKSGTNVPAFAVDRNGNLSHANGRRVVVRRISGYDCLTLE